MMEVLLMVLKALGISALVILSIILLLILFILFIPVRYKGQVSYKEKLPDYHIKVSWLLRTIQFEIKNNDGMNTSLKLFGKTVSENDTEAVNE